MHHGGMGVLLIDGCVDYGLGVDGILVPELSALKAVFGSLYWYWTEREAQLSS